MILYVLAVLAIILGVYLAIRMLVFWQEAKEVGGEQTALFDPKLMAYIGIGMLAAYWMPPIREAGPAATQGAGAAALAALIGGIVNSIITTMAIPKASIR